MIHDRSNRPKNSLKFFTLSTLCSLLEMMSPIVYIDISPCSLARLPLFLQTPPAVKSGGGCHGCQSRVALLPMMHHSYHAHSLRDNVVGNASLPCLLRIWSSWLRTLLTFVLHYILRTILSILCLIT